MELEKEDVCSNGGCGGGRDRVGVRVGVKEIGAEGKATRTEFNNGAVLSIF